MIFWVLLLFWGGFFCSFVFLSFFVCGWPCLVLDLFLWLLFVEVCGVCFVCFLFLFLFLFVCFFSGMFWLFRCVCCLFFLGGGGCFGGIVANSFFFFFWGGLNFILLF